VIWTNPAEQALSELSTAPLVRFSVLALSSIFFLVDPFAAIPSFLAITASADPARRRRMARKGALTCFIVLTSFAVGGQLIFKMFGITLPAFEVAGGLILLLIGLDMLEAKRSPTQEAHGDTEEAATKAVNPPTEHFFTGKERDTESGNDYFGARYFESSMGRFLSPDPLLVQMLKPRSFLAHIGNPQTWNKYAYVLNNPLIAIDPDGLDTYVVLYTTGNSHGDKEIKRAAETRANEIAHSKTFDSTKDVVITMGVKTRGDFKNAVTGADEASGHFGSIREFDLFSHGGTINGPVFHEDEYINPGANNPYGGVQLGRDEISALPKLSWASGATASFYACNSRDFAADFASSENVRTFGTKATASFSSNPNHYEPDNGGSLYEAAFWFGIHVHGPLNQAEDMAGYGK
jgi:RHS repeat-associated protein